MLLSASTTEKSRFFSFVYFTLKTYFYFFSFLNLIQIEFKFILKQLAAIDRNTIRKCIISYYLLYFFHNNFLNKYKYIKSIKSKCCFLCLFRYQINTSDCLPSMFQICLKKIRIWNKNNFFRFYKKCLYFVLISLLFYTKTVLYFCVRV